MVDVTILHPNDEMPVASGDYVQVVARQSLENPGEFVSDIEHFTLDQNGAETSLGRETKSVGFERAVELARQYADAKGVDQIYAMDRTAEDLK